MTDIHDIKPIIEVSIIDWKILLAVGILTALILCAIVLYLAYRFFVKRQKTVPRQPKIDYKGESLKKLQDLYNVVQKQKELNADEVYFQISNIIRWYIGGMRTINGLAKTRREVYVQLTKCFDELLWRCYLVEFAGVPSSKKEILRDISESIEKVKSCI